MILSAGEQEIVHTLRGVILYEVVDGIGSMILHVTPVPHDVGVWTTAGKTSIHTCYQQVYAWW
jgi:hypothetical protein